MNKDDKIEILKLIIWFNLFIGMYNLYIFNEMSSTFHLVLGIINIGVWVFNRHQLQPILVKVNSGTQNKKRP